MELQFTPNWVVDTANDKFKAKVIGVINSAEEDVTGDFFAYCKAKNLALDTEENLREAAYAYGRDRFPSSPRGA